MSRRSILAEASAAYQESRARHDQYRDRGDHDRADEYLSEMQEMEACLTVIENSIAWRRTIDARHKRERAQREAKR